MINYPAQQHQQRSSHAGENHGQARAPPTDVLPLPTSRSHMDEQDDDDEEDGQDGRRTAEQHYQNVRGPSGRYAETAVDDSRV